VSAPVRCTVLAAVDLERRCSKHYLAGDSTIAFNSANASSDLHPVAGWLHGDDDKENDDDGRYRDKDEFQHRFFDHQVSIRRDVRAAANAAHQWRAARDAQCVTET
jgi:hypothetical protein